MYVCVFFPFILDVRLVDIPAGVAQEEGLTRCMYIWSTHSKSKDQPGNVANPARGKLSRENNISLSLFAPKKWSGDTGSAVPLRVSLLISILGLNLVLAYGIPPDFRGGVHLFIQSAVRHRIRPEFIGSRNCAPMAFTAYHITDDSLLNRISEFR